MAATGPEPGPEDRIAWQGPARTRTLKLVSLAGSRERDIPRNRQREMAVSHRIYLAHEQRPQVSRRVICWKDNADSIPRRADVSFRSSLGLAGGQAAASGSQSADRIAEGSLPVFVGRHPAGAGVSSESRKTYANAQLRGFYASLPEQTAR